MNADTPPPAEQSKNTCHFSRVTGAQPCEYTTVLTRLRHNDTCRATKSTLLYPTLWYVPQSQAPTLSGVHLCMQTTRLCEHSSNSRPSCVSTSAAPTAGTTHTPGWCGLQPGTGCHHKPLNPACTPQGQCANPHTQGNTVRKCPCFTQPLMPQCASRHQQPALSQHTRPVAESTTAWRSLNPKNSSHRVCCCCHTASTPHSHTDLAPHTRT
jgi:hypothetical protein